METKPFAPQKEESFFMSNVIVENYSPYTPTESDLMILLVSRLQSGKYTYRFHVKEVLEALDIKDSHYLEVIKAMKGLRAKYYAVKYVTPEKERRSREVNVIGHIDWPDNDEKKVHLDSWIELSISNSIAPELFNLKNNFTAGMLSDYLKLSGKNAKKLFLLFVRWKSTGYMIKTIDELQKILGTNYTSYKHFNNDLIKPTIKQIQEKTSVKNIKRDHKKKGRSIYKLIFNFDYQEPQSPQYQISLPPSMGAEGLSLYDRLVTEHRLTNRQANIILEHVPLAGIRSILARIQRSDYKEIGSYTAGAFRKEYQLTL